MEIGLSGQKRKQGAMEMKDREGLQEEAHCSGLSWGCENEQIGCAGRRSQAGKAALQGVRQERKGASNGAGPVRRQGGRVLQDMSMIWV